MESKFKNTLVCLSGLRWKINQSIIKKCTIQIFPHIFDPARLLSTRLLLYSLNRSMCAAIFPQITTTSVCLGFFLHTSSMPKTYRRAIERSRRSVTPGGEHCYRLLVTTYCLVREIEKERERERERTGRSVMRCAFCAV